MDTLWGKSDKIVPHKFSLEVEKEREEVPRVPVSTVNDTPAAVLSGEALFTRQRKEKNTRKVKHFAAFFSFLIFDAPPVQTWAFLSVFVAPRKWKHERRSSEKWGTLRWKERVESEQGSTGAVFIQTAKPERGKWNILLMCCLQYNLALIPNIPQSVNVVVMCAHRHTQVLQTYECIKGPI